MKFAAASRFACVVLPLWLDACGGGDSSPAPAAPAPAPVPLPAPTPPLPPVDMQAPTAALTAPLDLASGLTGRLMLSATASDNVGVTGVEFQVDGMPVGATATIAPYAVSLDTTLYASG